MILRTGARKASARDLAEEILKMGDPPGLSGLLHHTLPDYQEIRGIGRGKAIQLASICEQFYVLLFHMAHFFHIVIGDHRRMAAGK